MKSNTTPDRIDEMTLEDIAKLGVVELAAFHDEFAAAAKLWQERKTKIVDALETLYAARAVNLLTQDGKDSGTITFPENDLT